MIRNVWNSIKEDKIALTSLIFLIVISLSAIFAFLSPYKPNDINLSNSFQSPSFTHWFGTDSLGRDYFTRILFGGRATLMVGFSVMILSTAIGTMVGAVSGYIGGIVDNILMRFLEIFMSIPTFFILLILSVILKSSLTEIIVVISVFSWMGTARVIRGEVLALREIDYVKCAESQGISSSKIIVSHIIPNIGQIVVVSSTMNAANAILMEAMLSFLGLGLKPPTASWGSMLNSAEQYMTTNPYLIIFPSIFIILVVLSFNCIGRAVQKGFGKN